MPSLYLHHHLSGDLDSRLSDKTWCLIKTNRPTNWKAGSGWAVLQIETVLVHYPLIEATKGSGKHPSKTHSYTSSEGIGFRTTKSCNECSNRELYRQTETKAPKHKYCRISPITQMMWQRTSFLASSQLFSWPLFTPSCYQMKEGKKRISQNPCQCGFGPEWGNDGLTESCRG